MGSTRLQHADFPFPKMKGNKTEKETDKWWDASLSNRPISVCEEVCWFAIS